MDDAEARKADEYTNLVCMCCGHIQPVQCDQLPSRCENCRESFNSHGYLLIAETPDAEDLSQSVLDSRASTRT